VLAGVVFPVSRIANIGWLAIAVDLLLLVCLAAMTTVLRAGTRASAAPAAAAAG
jgi:hypothetical protein